MLKLIFILFWKERCFSGEGDNWRGGFLRIKEPELLSDQQPNKTKLPYEEYLFSPAASIAVFSVGLKIQLKYWVVFNLFCYGDIK